MGNPLKDFVVRLVVVMCMILITTHIIMNFEAKVIFVDRNITNTERIFVPIETSEYTPDVLQEQVEDVFQLMNLPDIELAIYTVMASSKFKVDPILLTTLINSESSYDIRANHNHKGVIGLTGVNTNYWNLPVNTPKEQIFSGAYILSVYLAKYKHPKKALKAYKGWSDLGERQANYVYSQYLKNKKGKE